jgi:transcriptional regulator with XRE-family HTH domain
MNHRLIKARLDVGLSQRQLANEGRKLGYPLTEITISRAERGLPQRPLTEARITLTLEKLGLKVTREELFPPVKEKTA